MLDVLSRAPSVTTQAHAALRSFLAPFSMLVSHETAPPQMLIAIAEGQTSQIVRALVAAEARADLLSHLLTPWETNGSVGSALHRLISGSLAAYLWATLPDSESLPVLAVEYEHATLPPVTATLLREAVLVVVLAALRDGAVFCFLRLTNGGEQVTVEMTTDRPGVVHATPDYFQFCDALHQAGVAVETHGITGSWTVTVSVPTTAWKGTQK
jgi:hypothetical protein